jgi:hypothetical protein
MTERKYTKCLIHGEVKDSHGLQVLQIKAKDARGFDFSLQLAAVEPGLYNRETTESVNADRVVTYLGGTPDTVGDIGTEIEIDMGEKREAHKLEAASTVYIPKGQPFKEKVLRNPEKRSFRLLITLPPKYVQPE